MGLPEIIRQNLHLANARIFDLTAHDLLYGAARDSRIRSNAIPLNPAAFSPLFELFHHVFMHRLHWHGADYKPVYGLPQPTLGRERRLGFIGMPKRKIVSYPARVVRETLTANLKTEVKRAYPGEPLTVAYEKIHRATGYSISTLQRITSGQNSPQLDTLADVANAIGTTVQALLTPRDTPGPRLRAVR